MNWYELSQIWGSLTPQQKMAYIGQYWGQSGTPMDFNQDGTVNVLDMIKVGQGSDVYNYTPTPVDFNPPTGPNYVPKPTGGTYKPKPQNPWMAPYPTQTKPNQPYQGTPSFKQPTPRNPYANLPTNKPMRAGTSWKR